MLFCLLFTLDLYELSLGKIAYYLQIPLFCLINYKTESLY